VAAVFTLKRAYGQSANPVLAELTKDPSIREWALRALTDRKGQLGNVPVEPIVAAFSDPNPRVRAQAAISFGRLGHADQADKLVPLTIDADPVVAHVAVKALVALGAADACLTAIGTGDSPMARGALRTLREMHSEEAVSGLVGKLGTVASPELRREVLSTLIRLYYCEGKWPGDWWNTRPDTKGPYYRREEWAQTKKIEQAIADALTTADTATAEHIQKQLAKHLIKSKHLAGISPAAASEAAPQVDIAKVLASSQNVPGSIGTLSPGDAIKATLAARGDAAEGGKLFARQGCIQCHTLAPDSTPIGPQLQDIGKRYSRQELLQSILDPSAKIAQGFETTAFVMANGKQYVGVVTVEGAEDLSLLDQTGKRTTIVKSDIDERVKMETSVMPNGLVNALTPTQLAGLLDYLESLRSPPHKK
jgi:putative heme-binding domain-containing protein